MSGNIRETWKLLGSILNSKHRGEIASCFNNNGTDICDKQEIVENFNDYFVNIGNRLAAAIPDAKRHFSDYLNNPSCNSFSLFPTDASEICKIVDGFKNKWSAGCDEIPVNILKLSIRFIAEPISKLINSSFSAGIFPNKLKIAKVCPIYKSGEKNSFSNYRPISILPSFSKVFEKAVSNRLLSFFEKKQLLIDNQYGFRPKHSTYMALLQMYDKISLAADKNEYSIGIFIDLSKAFDTLNHSILIKKLEHYGIRGIPLEWFKNYLSERKQYVFLNDASSATQNVTCGVPQGSVLGPLLFIIYINDIIKCSDLLNFILFADDTNLFYSNENLIQMQNLVNNELSKLSEWFRANKLSLNAVKTHYMLFGNKPFPKTLKQLNINLDGNIIEQVKSIKFLGVFFDEKLKWNVHVNHVVSKISRGLGVLGRVRNIVPFDVLRTLYYTLIYPYLVYCCIIWGGAAAATSNRLSVLQNRAVRLITHSPFRASAGPLYGRLNLLQFKDIRKFQLLVFMFKCKYKLLLPKPCIEYCPVNLYHPYEMRCSHYFYAFSFRTSIRELSISVQGPKLWNSLPDALSNCISLETFKREVVKFFVALY